MKVIVILDENNGMMFNHRRQSQDRMVKEDIMEMIQDFVLYMNEYSYSLFQEYKNIKVDVDFLNNNHEYCFVENQHLEEYIDDIDMFIIYRWNRQYPADFFFDVDLSHWEMIESIEFHGSSHETITREIYRRKS